MRHIKPSSMGVSLVVILPLLWKGITSQIIYPPRYSIQVSSSVSVQEGLCVTIPCTFTADGRNTFSSNSFGYWIRMPLYSDYIVATNNKSSDVRKTNFYLTGNPDTGDCTLTITDARKEDEGAYYYRFEESKDSKVKYIYYREMRITITVPGITSQTKTPPSYSIKVSPSVSVQEGLCVTIPCTFTADNRNTFRNSFGYWKQSDHIVATNDKSSVVQKTNFHLTGNPDTGDCTLTITDARKEDARRYYFRFEESRNSAVKYNYYGIMPAITVIGPNIRITWGMNGRIDKKSDIIKVGEGSSVTLRCSVQSDLTLNVTWTDNNNNVLQNGTGKDLELRLENMTMNHTGTYTCSAWNWNKSLINSVNINVTVQYTPRNMEITIRSSTGEEHPINSQVDINQNETLTLVCRADGNPPVTVVWVRGEDDTDTSEIISSKLSAVINVTDSEAGVYRCSAWNAVGFKEKRFRVGKKTGLSGYADELNETHDTNLFGGIAIGFICGLTISTLIILLYKLYTRKKITKKNTDVSASGMSAGAESPKDDIYMNTSGPDPVAEEATYDRVQVDSSGAGRNEDALLYSTVNFAAKRSKVTSSQPETEYAEVHVK